MADRFTNPVPQYLSNIGLLLPGGKLFFFESGTSTGKDTFNDPDGDTANTNPLIIDGAGRVPNCFYDGAAKVRLTDANDVLIWERDPVLAGGGGFSFADYNSVTTYSQGDIVMFNDRLYQSKTSQNQNNQPDTSLTQWEEIEFNRVYNSTTTYILNDIVTDAGFNYRSLNASNTNNTPAASPTFWELAGTNATGNTIINVGNAEASGDAVNLAMATAASLYF